MNPLSMADGTSADIPAPEQPLPRKQSVAGDAVMIIDIDQSAAIRSRHGSAAGEQVTQAVAECLRRRLRAGDRLALVREDEFLAVLPGAPLVELPRIEARLREGVAALRLSLAGTEWRLTCTIGSASCQQMSEHSQRLESLVRMADAALHRARTQPRAVAA